MLKSDRHSAINLPSKLSMSKIPYSILRTAVLVIFLSGCAAPMTRVTDESDKDITGKYDGLWNVEVHKSPALQFIQNWEMTCGNFEHETNLVIKNGTVVSLGGKNTSETITYVSKEGTFRYIEPLAEKAEASGISDISMTDGSIKMIFNGKLSDTTGKGYLTIGIAQFGYDGCKAKVSFIKDS